MQTIELIRGDDAVIPVTFTQNGVAVNLTGYTVYFTAKLDLDNADDDAEIKKDITSHTNAAAGQTSIVLTNTDTAIAGEYYWDLQLKSGAGKISSTQMGKLRILQDVTRR